MWLAGCQFPAARARMPSLYDTVRVCNPLIDIVRVSTTTAYLRFLAGRLSLVFCVAPFARSASLSTPAAPTPYRDMQRK